MAQCDDASRKCHLVTCCPSRHLPPRHPSDDAGDFDARHRWHSSDGSALVSKQTFETSQTDIHGIGSARSLRLKYSSQKKPSQYCDTAHMRHTFRNECTQANFGARIRYSDNVSGPLPTSTVVLPNCVHRPRHQVDISMPRDATDRPLPVSRSSREKFLNNRTVLESATKMRKTRPPFR
jgi:hypothetical protein